MTTPSRNIRRFMEVLQVASRIEKAPGFSNYLGLTTDFYSKLSPSELQFDNATTTAPATFHVQMPISRRLYLPHRSSVSLSTYMAAMDDVTTWALVLGDEKRGRAGVSVALNAEWGPAAHHHRRRKNLPCDAVDIQATISKIGRNLGFVWAEIKDASTGELLCHGSHIKYLPMGPLMDFMQHINGRKLAIWYADNFLKYHPPVDDRPLADLFEPSFQMQSDTRATFQVGREHASLGGPIHGGCQAVLMELAATEALKRTCPTMTATLDSIHVEYLSSPGGKEVELVVELLPCSDSSPIVPVQVSLISKGRTSSTGLLRFTREVDSSALLLSKL